MKTRFGLAFPFGLAALFLVCFTGMQAPAAAAGDPGFLGVYSTDDGSGKGAIINGCVEGAPAEATGLKPGDRIISFNGKKVKSADDLIKALSQTEAGDTVEFVFVRDGEEIFSEVTLASKKKYTEKPDLPVPPAPPEKPEKPQKKAPTVKKPIIKELPRLELPKKKVEKKKEQAGGGKAFLGVQLGQGKNTVRIEGVIDGSPALEAGILCGDEVISVNGKEVENPEQFASMIGSMKPGKVAVLKILRDGQIIKTKVKTGASGGGQMPAEIEEDVLFEVDPDMQGNVQFFGGDGEGIHVLKGIGSGAQTVIIGEDGEIRTRIAGCAGECSGKGDGCKGCVLFSEEGDEGGFEMLSDKFILHGDGDMFEILENEECECEGDCAECTVECECDEECVCENVKVITRSIAVPGKDGVLRLKVVGGEEDGEYKIEVVTDEEEGHAGEAHNMIITNRNPQTDTQHKEIIVYSDPESGGTGYKVIAGDEILDMTDNKAFSYGWVGGDKDVKFRAVSPGSKVWIAKPDVKVQDEPKPEDHKCSCKKCQKKQNVKLDHFDRLPHQEGTFKIGAFGPTGPTGLGHLHELPGAVVPPPVPVEKLHKGYLPGAVAIGSAGTFDVHKCRCAQCGKAGAPAKGPQACKVIKQGAGGCCGSTFCGTPPHSPHAVIIKQGCQGKGGCGSQCITIPHATAVKKGCGCQGKGGCGSSCGSAPQGEIQIGMPHITRKGNCIIIDLSTLKTHMESASKCRCSCGI